MHRSKGGEMRAGLRACATVVLTAILAGAMMTASVAAEGDQELTARVIAGSPWMGTFGYGEGGPEAGTMTVTFNVIDGKLAGEVTAFSGRGTVKPGPLEKVELKDGQLSFVTPSNGVYQEMRFE